MEIKRTETRAIDRARERMALTAVLAYLLVTSVSCTTGTEPAPQTNANENSTATNTAAQQADTGEQAYGRAAMRLQIKYIPKRTVTGGVAFAIDAPGGPIVLTSAHIIATMGNGKKLESVSIVDGVTREPVCKTLGVVWAGKTFEGFDFSKDVTALAVEDLPESIVRLKLATDRPAIGTRVRILGIPSDGSTTQVSIEGVVTVATSLRHEIDIDPTVKGRGLAGSPIVLEATGQVIGIVQAVTAKQGRAFVIATPAEAILRLVPTAKPEIQPISVWTGQ